MHERVAIVGTAQSWSKTPWTDTGLHIRSLNDAYRMKGFVRADAWYDFHPLDKFYCPENEGHVYAHQIPPGHYCRPKDHLQWLSQQQIPVWLHPDYLTQCPDAVNWVNARPFPKAEIEASYGTYFTSSPGWMIAQALLEGVKELHIYGIHLATEHEYIEQRPNFEMLCGALLGRGKRTITVADGMRHYETKDGILVLPEAAPVLQSAFQYAFQSRPASYVEPLKWELHKIDVKHARIVDALKKRSTFSPFVKWEEPRDGTTPTPIRMTMGGVKDVLIRLEATAADYREQIDRLNAEAQWA
jgi:hypothetical protein